MIWTQNRISFFFTVLFYNNEAFNHNEKKWWFSIQQKKKNLSEYGSSSKSLFSSSDFLQAVLANLHLSIPVSYEIEPNSMARKCFSNMLWWVPANGCVSLPYFILTFLLLVLALISNNLQYSQGWVGVIKFLFHKDKIW